MTYQPRCVCIFSLVAARLQKMETYEVDSCVHGHHVFRGIWNPTIGEQLVCKREVSNTQDVHAVAVMREAMIRDREESPHIDRVGTTGRSFPWKNLYDTIYDLRLSYSVASCSSVILHLRTD